MVQERLRLEKFIDDMKPADEEAMKKAACRWDSLAKPLGSLGMLERAVIRIAGIQGTPQVELSRRELLVLCADNGVTAQGVSQSDAGVTRAVAAALGQGTSTACHMARAVSCRVIPVDIGMEAHPPLTGVADRSVQEGTADFTLRAAMSRQACLQAILTGIGLVRERKKAKVSIVLAGEMGIGNTTTSAAVASVLLGEAPSALAGPGAGLSSEGLIRKIKAIEEGIRVNRPDASDPVDVLAKVGGLDLAGLCGICLGGAYYRVPVLLDGLITAAAALCAVRLCPGCRFALLGSHQSAEPAAARLLKELELEAPLKAGLRLGEGTGALAGLAFLDLALSVYHSGHTFEHLGIEAYHKWQ